MSESEQDPPTEGEPAPRSRAQLSGSQRLFVGAGAKPDEYELIDRGRRGGEGSVFRARYRGSLPQAVDFALKQLLVPPGVEANQWPNPALVDRWQEQLKLLHLIRDEHLVAYRELFSGWPPHPGRSCGGDPPEGLATWYLLMDWVDGPSLHELVRTRSATLSERAGYLVELAQAVEVLHSGSTTGGMILLHRDIKPSNVLIDPVRGAVLVDYGLLRVEEPVLTEIPAWTGPYLAPEVHMDKTRTSRASDMWALAATALFALTGDHPSPGEPDRMRGQLFEHLSGQVVQPEAVTDVVMSALDPNPARRPSSPLAWAHRLEWSLGDSVTPRTSTGGPTIPMPIVAEPGAGAPTDGPSGQGAQPAPPRHGENITVIDDPAGPQTSQERSRPTKTGRRRAWLGAVAALLLLAAAIGIDQTLNSPPPRNSLAATNSHSTNRGTTAADGTSTTGPGVATSTSTQPATDSGSSSAAGALGSASSSGPAIDHIQFSGGPSNFTLTIDGSGFGSATRPLPFSGDLPNFRIADSAQIGHGEWGYVGDANSLTYQNWTDSQIVVGALGAEPGDALVVALWNSTSGAGASWGGDVARAQTSAPMIRSVIFSGSTSNPQVTINGNNFGSPPTAMPFTGRLQNFVVSDWRIYRAGNGSSATWSSGVTEQFISWSNTSIVIGGFGGTIGQGTDVLEEGDPVSIQIWAPASGYDSGPQIAWGGTYRLSG